MADEEPLRRSEDGSVEMRVQRVGRRQRDETRIVAIVVVVALAIGVSVAKPWSSTPDATSTPETLAVPGAAGLEPSPFRGPTPMPSPPDASAAFCMDPSGWRVTSLQRFAGQTVREWQTVDPIAASGPLDLRMPVALVVSTSVMSLGWCAPPFGDERPTGPVRTTIWRIGEDGIAQRVTPGTGSRSGALGADYAPPVPDGQPFEWAPGRYVLDVEGAGPSDSHWFAVTVIRFVIDRLSSPAPRVVHPVTPVAPTNAPLP
jgi:hypothetical protein